MNKNPMKNSEGYSDLTAYYGTREIVKEETEIERNNRNLIHAFRMIADLAEFEIVGRITLRHKKSGKVFK